MNLLKLGLSYDNASLQFKFEKDGKENFDVSLSPSIPKDVQIYLNGLQNMIGKLSTKLSSGQIHILLSEKIDKRIFSSLKKLEKYQLELNFEYRLVIE